MSDQELNQQAAQDQQENEPQVPKLTTEEIERARKFFNEKLAPTMKELVQECEANKVALVFAARFETDVENEENGLNAACLIPEAFPAGEMIGAQIVLESKHPIEAILRLTQMMGAKVQTLNLENAPEEIQQMVNGAVAEKDASAGDAPAAAEPSSTTAS
jgi:hypothetical protein